jgi:hypothetical protein
MEYLFDVSVVIERIGGRHRRTNVFVKSGRLRLPIISLV